MWKCRKCGCEVIMDFVQNVRCTATSLPKKFDESDIESDFTNIYYNYDKTYVSFCCSGTIDIEQQCCWGDTIEEIAYWEEK